MTGVSVNGLKLSVATLITIGTIIAAMGLGWGAHESRLTANEVAIAKHQNTIERLDRLATRLETVIERLEQRKD